MDGLRWLLLLFGVLVVVGVYVYSRRNETTEDETPIPGRRVEPTLVADADPEPAEARDAAVAVPEIVPDVGATAEPDEEAVSVPSPAQKIVTLRLVAKGRAAFPGDELILSLRGIGMRHGKFGIYHRVDGDDENRTIFSAASLVEPGSFDLDNIREQTIPGISLFLVLPCPLDGVEAFDMMVEAARTLAQSLDGELLDESGSTLSIQRERYMREEIVQFTHSPQIAG